MEHKQIHSEARERVDAAARSLAEYGAVLEEQGEDSSGARQSLLFQLQDPDLNIVGYILKSLHSETPTIIVEDVMYRLYEVMDRSIVGSKDGGTGVDLRQLADSSPVAWITAVLRTAAPRATANSLRDRNGEVSVSPAVMSQVVSAVPFDATDEHLFPLDREVRERESAAADEAITELTGLAADSRLITGAQLLHRVFQIPPITVPITRFAKANLANVCEQHPHLVHSSLVEAASAPPDARESPLRELWTQFTMEDAAELLSRTSQVTTTIVTAALSPRPRPSSRTIKKLIATLRQASRGASWGELCSGLVESWLTEFYAHRSSYDRVSTATGPALSPNTHRSWMAVVESVVNYPGSPLGREVRTPHDVDLRLRCILAELRDQ